MGTRTQIAFQDTDVKIYQHWDGYPESILPTLMEFVKFFMKHRGYDEFYMPARYLMWLGKEDYIERLEKIDGLDYSDVDWKDQYDCLSYGVDTEWHGDIEYKYFVNQDGSIKVVDLYKETEFIIPLKTNIEKAVKNCNKAFGRE